MIVPAYFLIGFPHDVEIFFTFVLIAVLISSSATGCAYFFSCAAGRETATKMPFGFLILCAIFGGPFLNSNTIPVYFKWLQQMTPVKYGYHSLMREFWTHVETIYCPPNTTCRATKGAQVLVSNVIKADKFASDCLILLGINLGFRVAGAIALAIRSRRKN